MPSVSNIAIGANMAAAAATKARHGMNESIARLSTGVRAMYGGDAAAVLAGVATGLGNIAADLTALKAFQGAASSTSANMAAAGARLIDTDFALETASLTKNAILNQAALAMAAQANSAQSSILSVLQ